MPYLNNIFKKFKWKEHTLMRTNNFDAHFLTIYFLTIFSIKILNLSISCNKMSRKGVDTGFLFFFCGENYTGYDVIDILL